MKIARWILCWGLAWALALGAPGLPAYAAASKAVGGAPAPVNLGPAALVSPAPAWTPSISVAAPALPGLSAPLDAGLPAVSGTPAAAASAAASPAASAPGLSTQGLAASPMAPVSAPERHDAAAPAEENSQTVLQGLSRELPDFSRMGDSAKQTSADDFLRRLGQRPAPSAALTDAAPTASAAGPLSGGALRPANPQRSPVATPPPASKWGRAALLGGLAGFFGAGATLSEVRAHAALLVIPIIVVSLILHEMGHARAGLKLGDSSAVLGNRGSFRPKDLLTHIDPWWTIYIPTAFFLATGAIVAKANEVVVNPRDFRRPVRDMALAALAGPAVNIGLAAAGAAAFAGLAAAGLGGGVLAAAAGLLTLANVGLALFNLIPFFPLDGHHILYAFLPSGPAARLKAFNDSAARKPGEGVPAWLKRGGFLPYVPLACFLAVVLPFGLMASAVYGLTSLVLGGAAVAGSAQLAGAALPALAALGLAMGSIKDSGPPTLNPDSPVPVESLEAGKALDLVVLLDGAARPLSQDAHLSFVDVSGRGGAAQYARAQQGMLAQLGQAGLSPETLASYGATPIATYQRINAATLRVDASRAEEFRERLRGLGYRVFENDRRRIIRPVPFKPEEVEPAVRAPVTMDETLAITKAVPVQEIARARWGAPESAGALRRLLLRLLGAVVPQPRVGVIDSGYAKEHPLLKSVERLVNLTSGEAKDDIGHGSWVTSMILNYAPWLGKLTHYKAFVDGGASLDDILKALTASANDGNLVISNSWGSDDGDPNGPDSLLVKKLAEEGRVLVFAAGNAGPGANTIGSPAIVHYKDAKTGALRVLAVAAADRGKKIAYFSSRGPGSPKAPGEKPELSAIGVNVEGAFPAELGPDRVDAVKGPLKAENGTSMSTPEVTGAIALFCMLFGVTEPGEKLDAVLNAVLGALAKTGQSSSTEGRGFLDLEAAYRALEGILKPVVPNFVARVLLGRSEKPQLRREAR